MKKFAFILACLLTMCITFAFADNDRVITVQQLPQTAQLFLKSHFSKNKVALVKMDNGVFAKDYEVTFTNGNKIDFDSKGNWEEIDCKASFVPVKVVPGQIIRYVKSNYPTTKIVKIERSRKEYEIKLSNRMELTFDKSFRLIEID
ncbi:MAG: PepSY-like domain-containing protein [Bacteroidales bacterium]|nr:PepSY-like domain-containing protein [Bacteroidales bacterium]MCM1147500.1 PepSY-like domain-containing protein [Bacteroidales bacterium]MCM1206169.1 PepSY-like domain-containing protein [Bacillota bacterium]MCM1509999.1 PepSY-like domain-containing protein [Clostridium sp.]